jgi:hypothetical protein
VNVFLLLNPLLSSPLYLTVHRQGNIGNKGFNLFLVVQFVVTSYYAFLEGTRNSAGETLA